MTPQDQNKALVNKIIQECWTSKPGLEALGAYVAPGYIHHAPFGELNLDGYRQASAALLEAFPDVRFSITHLVAEGDMVAAYLKSVGTHLGPFGPVAPTSKVLTFTGAYHCRIVEGKIVEDWDAWIAQPIVRQVIAMLQS